MPEYLAPGVFVEETSFRSKSIEGVSTSTTGFVGPTRKGPLNETPELITSFGDFERIYGGFANLKFGEKIMPNYIAHAVKNYFDNGGRRLFIARVYQAPAGQDGLAASSALTPAAGNPPPADPPPPGPPPGNPPGSGKSVQFKARTPGAVGNGTIKLTLKEAGIAKTALKKSPSGSLAVTPEVEGQEQTTYVKRGNDWEDSSGTKLEVKDDTKLILITLNVLTRDNDGDELSFEDLGFSPGHPLYVGDVLNSDPSRRIDQLENTFAITIGKDITPFELHSILSQNSNISLSNGSDGLEPVTKSYNVASEGSSISPLERLGSIEDISIVAAPGYSAFQERQGIQDALITHAESRRAYRIAVLDTRQGITPTGAIDDKSQIDSTYAALYYPWVWAANPNSQPGNKSIPSEILLPPSGFICGIFARNDNQKGVAKSPGNEIVRGGLRFETDINFAQQEVLNPKGVNCLRFFPGRGNRLWGSRTTSSDPEWKYVGPRRYFLYLEHSIDRSTQWAVFENNGPRLWANIRETISGFLYNEWKSGSLLGANPDEAFFVRCDRTTMTQNDLDNGRLICLVGVAVLKPAEFVVFRIGQKTADSRG